MATYSFDVAHSAADFSARHMMISTVRGGFRKMTGTIEFDKAHPEESSVEAIIDTRSLTSTGVDQRDAHLRSPDFLDVEKYPTITFKSTKVEPSKDGSQASITGDLTIRGVTRLVTLNAEFLGENVRYDGKKLLGFSASTKINREDFGLTWNMALETGGWMVSKDITITLDVEAVLNVEEPAVAVAV